MTVPTVLNAYAVASSIAKPDTPTYPSFTLTPPAEADALVMLDQMTNNWDVLAAHTYGTVAMTRVGTSAPSSYACLLLEAMPAIAVRSTDAFVYSAQWATHWLYAMWLSGSDGTILDSDIRQVTDWSYAGQPLTVDGGGKDGLAVISESIDENTASRIYTPPVASSGATVTLWGTKSGSGESHRIWHAPVLASDGAVTFTVKFSGQGDGREVLIGGASPPSKPSQAIIIAS